MRYMPATPISLALLLALTGCSAGQSPATSQEATASNSSTAESTEVASSSDASTDDLASRSSDAFTLEPTTVESPEFPGQQLVIEGTVTPDWEIREYASQGKEGLVFMIPAHSSNITATGKASRDAMHPPGGLDVYLSYPLESGVCEEMIEHRNTDVAEEHTPRKDRDIATGVYTTRDLCIVRSWGDGINNISTPDSNGVTVTEYSSPVWIEPDTPTLLERIPEDEVEDLREKLRNPSGVFITGGPQPFMNVELCEKLPLEVTGPIGITGEPWVESFPDSTDTASDIVLVYSEEFCR